VAKHLFKDNFKVGRLDPDGNKFNKDNLSLAAATLIPPLHHNVISSSETVKVAIRHFALYYAVL
jgi:hypothetical protein